MPPQPGIKGQLADGDAHAASALVAEPEDALAVADDDDAHGVEQRIGEDVAEPMAVGIAEEQATGLAPDLAEPLATFPDGRRVDQRQQLAEIVGEQAIEQGLVGVEQVAQEGVALEVAAERSQHPQAASRLAGQRPHMRRQDAVEPERIAFLVAEGGALVEDGSVDEVVAAQRRFDDTRVIGKIQLGHGRPPSPECPCIVARWRQGKRDEPLAGAGWRAFRRVGAHADASRARCGAQDRSIAHAALFDVERRVRQAEDEG